jgi:hypothetical protein
VLEFVKNNTPVRKRKPKVRIRNSKRCWIFGEIFIIILFILLYNYNGKNCKEETYKKKR